MRIDKYRNVEPGNAAHLPTLDNRVRFSHHRGFMSLRRVGCVYIYSVDGCFSLDLQLRLLGLPQLILGVVILIVFRCKFSRYLAVKGSKFGFELLQLVLLAINQ